MPRPVTFASLSSTAETLESTPNVGPETAPGTPGHRTETVMAGVEMRVLSDIWVGPPYGVGSLHLRKGSIVTVNPADAGQIAKYGGSGNLRPLRPDETGDDTDHAELGN